MHVADEVERAVLLLAVVPERLALDSDGIYLGFRAQDEDVAEAFALEGGEGAAQLLALAANDVRAEGTVRTMDVAVLADTFGEIQDDGNRERVIAPREGDEGSAGIGLDVGGVHDGEASGRETLGGDVVQHVKGVCGGGEVILVV